MAGYHMSRYHEICSLDYVVLYEAWFNDRKDQGQTNRKYVLPLLLCFTSIFRHPAHTSAQ
jgi:hypothetical protein